MAARKHVGMISIVNILSIRGARYRIASKARTNPVLDWTASSTAIAGSATLVTYRGVVDIHGENVSAPSKARRGLSLVRIRNFCLQKSHLRLCLFAPFLYTNGL